MMILGLFPKAGALATIIPTPVLGGAMVFMFSMISVQGIRMLIKIDFTNEKNLIIMAVSMGLGLGVSVYSNIFQFLPQALQLLLANGIVIASISAVLLNLILNGLHQEN